MTRHQIGTLDDFPEGIGVPINTQGIDIAVFKLNDELHAILDSCRHKNLSLHQCGHPRYRGEETRKIDDSENNSVKGAVNYDDLTIQCPWHNLEWDLRTGENPVLDTSIPVYDVVVEGEEVYIDL